MKFMTREFTNREKVLLLILSLVLVALLYYQFIDQPVRRQLEAAQADAEMLSIQVQAVEAKLKDMRRMQTEMDDLISSGAVSEMGSYNNSKEEMAILNDVLQHTQQYSISFADVTRDGDQIRRNFTLLFAVNDYASMEKVIKELADSDCRCLIGDVQCSQGTKRDQKTDFITVNATATFFETMVGGTPDAGLPEEKAN
jgi:hypothetical protein